MGVADEWEEVEEYSQQMEQMKRQVSNLTAALTKMKTEESTEDANCLVDGCKRPIDWYCKYCKSFICTKCSKKPCGDQDKHEIIDFEEMYESCKKKYMEWKSGKESTLKTLAKQQKKLQDEIAKEIQKMSGASPDDLLGDELAKVVSELPAKRKLLEDVTKQVKEAGNSLDSYGVNIESLNHKEFIQVFDQLDLYNYLFEATDVSKITLSPEFTTVPKKYCYAIDRLPTGEVLLAGNPGFDVCDANGKVLKNVTVKGSDFTGIQYYKGKIYGLLKGPGDSTKREVIVYELPHYKQIYRWDLPDYAFISQLAVSNDKVYAVDIVNKRVKMFSLTGTPMADFVDESFQKPIYMGRCAPDGVLLADLAAEKVHKVECSADRIVWSFDLRSPRGVYCDKNGNIWVWSSRHKAFYVRSSDGKQLKKLEHPKLEKAGAKNLDGMVIINDEIWAAACGMGCVRVKVNMNN